jgi:Na+/glutamate symporter
MDTFGLIAIILCCGLFADILIIRSKLKELEKWCSDLERPQR